MTLPPATWLYGTHASSPSRQTSVSGRIVPAGPGSIAVIGAGAADLGQVTGDVLAAVVWL